MKAVSFSVPKPFQKFDAASAEKKIINFIRKIVKDSGSKGVVLGLSGGIDSALVAALCSRALGVENVHPIFFDSTETGKLDNVGDSCDFCNSGKDTSKDYQDAVLICEQFGLTLQKINLLPTFDAAVSSFGFSEPNSNLENLVPFGNLKSRLHMSLLYYYANSNNLLVIGTTNKTERLIGYYTKYGDGGVDLDPIADLYKTEVRLLSKFMNLPESVLIKAPSAGFWEGQSDEADFGLRYEQLDYLLYEIEKAGIEKSNSVDSKEMGKDMRKALNQIHLTDAQYYSILLRMKAAEHKRKLPKFPKISSFK
ncbi:MAG: NAD(+) synthase [Methanosarcinales archaeon]|nr:NAD(+) synthase [Methanosarcinales archaeon]